MQHLKLHRKVTAVQSPKWTPKYSVHIVATEALVVDALCSLHR